MTKLEYIAKYGEEAWNDYLAYYRNYYKNNKEHHKKCCKNWYEEHKEQHSQRARKWTEEHREQSNNISKIWENKSRQKGSTKYCRVNFDLIENYDLAKADNFDPKKWHLHHRLENYWSSSTLKRKGLYFNVNPEALIWLPFIEHSNDIGKSIYHPEQTKWHQRIYEQTEK